MKRYYRLFLGFASMTALIIALATSAAAYCVTIVSGGDANGTALCTNTGEDADYCYYNCSCIGNCDNVYEELMMEDDNGSPCPPGLSCT
jgi:hypothetical protein